MDASERMKRAAKEAAEWWVLMQGEPSRHQREQYIHWLRESVVHVAEMLRVAKVHGALAQFERWARLPVSSAADSAENIVPLRVADPPASAQRDLPPHPPRTWRLVGSIAAMIMIIAGGTAAVLLWTHGQVIETERGERREIVLADGSVVQIDPETRLRVDYRPHERQMLLERGRALFHVAKDTKRPFRVQADGTSVRAVGTIFAVEEAPDAVVVTVAEGKVAVLPTGAATKLSQARHAKETAQSRVHIPATVSGLPRSENRPTLGSPPSEIVLNANEQMTVQEAGNTEAVRQVDSARALAWAQGRLIFENDSVERAVAQFNRYNRIQITVTDPALAQRPISGVFSAADPESFVAFIQTVATVLVTRDDAQNISIAAER